MAAEITDLPWHGAETEVAAKRARARGAGVELQSLAGYHYAVYARLGSAAQAGAAETLEVAGGAGLRGCVAAIRGLEDIGALEAPAARARACVRVVSPNPAIAIVCERAAAERGA